MTTAGWKEPVRSAASMLVRRVDGSDRVIKDLPEWAGLGNQLFFFLWASTQRRHGVDFHLVRSRRCEYWLEQFPRLASLTIDTTDVRLADSRDRTDWPTLSSLDRPSTPSRGDVNRFIDAYLLPSRLFDSRTRLNTGLTINVRRGDYFTDPEVRGRFSFDQIAYISVVMDRLRDEGRAPREIRVVSDDITWCRSRLQHLARETDALVFVESGGPVQDLRTVARSRELVIMNSSFSIWAAFISNVIHGDNHRLIHAPAFGTRPFDGSPWPSLDPRWDIITSIPGGWDS